MDADEAVAGAPAGSGPSAGDDQDSRRSSDIYTHEFATDLYAMAWSVRPDQPFRLAVGSFVDNAAANCIELVQLDDERGAFVSRAKFPHPYPATKLQFIPDKDTSKPDLLATAADYLRIWQVTDDGVRLEKLLNNNSQREFCAPLTSFDWNEINTRRIGTASIDTTCTIWDLERGCVDTQLIAHDREVYDIAWGGVGVFATVSADGSVRVFDLRDKEHSTIIYESGQPPAPLYRIGWNKQDPRLMATITMDSNKVVILDIRYPTLPFLELQRHQAPVNSLCWAPHSASHMCTAGEDARALIWELSNQTGNDGRNSDIDPILAYTAEDEINQLQWAAAHPDWVGICFANKLQVLRV